MLLSLPILSLAAFQAAHGGAPPSVRAGATSPSAGRAAIASPATARLSPKAAGNASGTFTVSVSPATISFAGINPASNPSVPGNSAATVTWQTFPLTEAPWNLTVQPSASSFANCPQIPLSAVTVTCTAASATIGGTASCAAPFALSTTAQTVASGQHEVLTYSWSVTISFTLADSWRYTAETSPSCSLNLSYVANVQ